MVVEQLNKSSCHGITMNSPKFQSKSQEGLRTCAGCLSPIHDQFILKVAPNLEWHSSCLKCSECKMFLGENQTCFVRKEKIFCRDDYLRLFGAKCDKCGESFDKNDYVMRARSKTFHMKCFRCENCKKQLLPGDEFALTSDGLLCKDDHLIRTKNVKEENNNDDRIKHELDEDLREDYEEEDDLELDDDDLEKAEGGYTRRPRVNSTGSQSRPNTTSPTMSDHGNATPGQNNNNGRPMQQQRRSRAGRVRTVLTEKQLSLLKTCYTANPRPDALMKEQLVEMTGLSPRVVRVWFQNKRCKDKKKIALKQGKECRKLGYAGMQGIPMVASSPLRHELHPGFQAHQQQHGVPIQSYEPPWKALCDFALNSDLDKGGTNYHQIINQIHDHKGGSGFPPGEYNQPEGELIMPRHQPPGHMPAAPSEPPRFDDRCEEQGYTISSPPLDSVGYTLTSLDNSSASPGQVLEKSPPVSSFSQ